MQFTRQRGTIDLYGDDVKYFTQLESVLRYLSSIFNFTEIRTPIFEATQLFTKAVGDTSDIVHKEFYNFKDKGDREIALRPEGTAGTIRAVVENKMLANITAPLKLFYIGPMFRYERPQSGRQRQFHQFGIEVIGDIKPNDEVECIVFALAILEACKVKNYHLEINNIGTAKTRLKWIEELKKYFKDKKNELSEDSLRRLDSNPLRILDDKEDGKKEFVKNAPKLDMFLTEEDNQYFNKIKSLLDLLKIDYQVNKNLVRGLDYYNGLVFEFVSHSDNLKGQSTIIGGGKYDGLVELTGGPNTPGVGFAIGLERLIIAIRDENKDFITSESIDILFAPLSNKCADIVTLISALVRANAFSVACNYGTTKLEKHFKYAEKLNAKYVAILGDKELEKGQIIIKDQKNKKEIVVKLSELDQWLKGKRN